MYQQGHFRLTDFCTCHRHVNAGLQYYSQSRGTACHRTERPLEGILYSSSLKRPNKKPSSSEVEHFIITQTNKR